MGMILLIIYMIAGYWAVGETIWANKIIIGSNLFVKRMCYAVILGWILIPVALLKMILFK